MIVSQDHVRINKALLLFEIHRRLRKLQQQPINTIQTNTRVSTTQMIRYLIYKFRFSIYSSVITADSQECSITSYRLYVLGRRQFAAIRICMLPILLSGAYLSPAITVSDAFANDVVKIRHVSPAILAHLEVPHLRKYSPFACCDVINVAIFFSSFFFIGFSNVT